jgi:hypothetical protein
MADNILEANEMKKIGRGRPKTKTEDELKENKRNCQKRYMETYKRDYTTKVICRCGIEVLKCNFYRHKNSKHHERYELYNNIEASESDEEDAN